MTRAGNISLAALIVLEHNNRNEREKMQYLVIICE